jgi:hypothetical protein
MREADCIERQTYGGPYLPLSASLPEWLGQNFWKALLREEGFGGMRSRIVEWAGSLVSGMLHVGRRRQPNGADNL